MTHYEERPSEDEEAVYREYGVTGRVFIPQGSDTEKNHLLAILAEEVRANEIERKWRHDADQSFMRMASAFSRATRQALKWKKGGRSYELSKNARLEKAKNERKEALKPLLKALAAAGVKPNRTHLCDATALLLEDILAGGSDCTVNNEKARAEAAKLLKSGILERRVDGFKGATFADWFTAAEIKALLK